MAGGAIGLTIEEGKTTPGSRANRIWIAHNPTIEWRTARHYRALERCQCLLNLGCGNPALAESCSKSAGITRNRREPLQHRFLRKIHILRRGNRPDRDSFEILEVTVPTELRRPRD